MLTVIRSAICWENETRKGEDRKGEKMMRGREMGEEDRRIDGADENAFLVRSSRGGESPSARARETGKIIGDEIAVGEPVTGA